jgi:hypothetical protein
MQRTKARTWRSLTVGAAALGIVSAFGFGASAQAAAPTMPRSAVHVKQTTVRDGYRCTVVSSAHHHQLVGRAGAVVCALSGNNTLTAAGPGQVVLIAGPGRDTLRASSSPNSNDILLGGRGKTSIFAGTRGTDIINTGWGSDWINCSNGSAHVTVVGVGSDDSENHDCHRRGVDDTSQYYHATVTALASDGSTMTVSVSDASDGAQAWLATQSPACDLTNLTFDLITAPASIHVDGGGTLVVGDDVGIGANAGTLNCEPVAVNVWGRAPGGNPGDGNESQYWEGTIGALASDSSTMTVSVSHSSDGAQSWLSNQNPACVPTNLTFDLKSAPATIEVENGGALIVGDHVWIEATAGTTNCVPVALVVHAGSRHGHHRDNGDQRWQGTIGAVASDSSTITVSVSDSSGSAQAWLATQSPGCDITNLVFDLTTAPANVDVDDGGSLAVGDNVEIDATAGTTNCEPVAVNVNAEAPQGNPGNWDQWQRWQGTVGALASDGSTVTVSVSDSSDSAQSWLAAQSPACDASNLVFDLTSAPANVYVDDGGPLAVGDNVDIVATAGATNCEPVAVDVYAQATGGSGGDD